VSSTNIKWLVGSIQSNAGAFSFVTKDLKSKRYFYLLDCEQLELSLLFSDAKSAEKNISRVSGAMHVTKISNQIFTYGEVSPIVKYLDIYAKITNYFYTKEQTLQYEEKFVGNVLCTSASYKTDSWDYSFYRKGRTYTLISFSDKDITVLLRESDIAYSMPSSLEYDKVVDQTEKRYLERVNTAVSSMDDLRLKHDLSWYEVFDESGVKTLKKNYTDVDSLEVFNSAVVASLCEEILKNKSEGKKTYVSVDTETTGLKIYALSKDNPYKDKIVAVQLSWADDQGVVVYLDMEYFDNVDNNTAIRFMYNLCGRTRDFKNRHIVVEVNDKTYEFERDDVVTVGHNAMFDIRVMHDSASDLNLDDVVFVFDYDTLQLLFDWYPEKGKGLRALKTVTRRFYGDTTLELDDILGKGNEGKYRFVSDREVACIYGCADTDYTRKILMDLLKVYPKELLEAYPKQNAWYATALAISEYSGIATKQEELRAVAIHTKDDLNVLEKFLFEYVGKFVSTQNYLKEIGVQKQAGLISEEEYSEKLKRNIPISLYEFKLNGNDVRIVLYKILGYPITRWTKRSNVVTQTEQHELEQVANSPDVKRNLKKKAKSTQIWGDMLPSVDNIAMENLMRETLEIPSGELIGNVYRAGDKNKILISEEIFNKYKYPVAYVLSIYKTLYKEYTTYFEPTISNNLEVRIFTSFSTTNIETRRTSSSFQTMKGDLKYLVVPKSDDYYLIDFDMTQMEYRYLASLAKSTEIINKLDDPEKDFHIETASLVRNIPAFRVTKKIRKDIKSVVFGKLYGLGDYRMCLNMWGKITRQCMIDTRRVIMTFENAQKDLMHLLNTYKERVLIPVPQPDLFYLAAGLPNGTKVGCAENIYGYRRYFQLEEGMSEGLKASLGRKAANLPIQGGSAEFFRFVLKRFYLLCLKYGISDKITWHMTVHDELLASVHKSVSPALVTKVVYEAAVIKPKGFTTFYVGMNIGRTWGDCKDDRSEMPVKAVQRMIKDYDEGKLNDIGDDPVKWFMQYKLAYVEQRIFECLEELQPGFYNSVLDADSLLLTFENYMVRNYVTEFYKPQRSDLKKDTDEYWVNCLESWILDRFGSDTVTLSYNGRTYKVVKQETESCAEIDVDIFEESDMEIEDIFAKSQDYWSFDDAVGTTVYDNSHMTDVEEEFDGYVIDDSKVGTVNSPNDLFTFETYSYKNLVKSKGSVTLTINKMSDVEKIKEYLKPFITTNLEGILVCFSKGMFFQRWVKVDRQCLELLDRHMTTLKEGKVLAT
jgi:DNA polymerase I-like protein with 3'-5' exonuclease and polymerase domains